MKKWPEVNSASLVQARYNHFLGVRLANPFLDGARHSDRFIRGTKLFITAGEFEGYHCVVVGHKNNFRICQNSPVLRVLIADLSIISVEQKNTRILDLHGYLPFGIPFDPDRTTDWRWVGTPSFWQHRFIGHTNGWGLPTHG